MFYNGLEGSKWKTEIHYSQNIAETEPSGYLVCACRSSCNRQAEGSGAGLWAALPTARAACPPDSKMSDIFLNSPIGRSPRACFILTCFWAKLRMQVGAFTACRCSKPSVARSFQPHASTCMQQQSMHACKHTLSDSCSVCGAMRGHAARGQRRPGCQH